MQLLAHHHGMVHHFAHNSMQHIIHHLNFTQLKNFFSNLSFSKIVISFSLFIKNLSWNGILYLKWYVICKISILGIPSMGVPVPINITVDENLSFATICCWDSFITSFWSMLYKFRQRQRPWKTLFQFKLEILKQILNIF